MDITRMKAMCGGIEVARASKTRKGFSIVATEMKNLSNQTATASNKIVAEIATVQKISSKVAKSEREAVSGVKRVSDYVQSIAVAIEEQSSATQEISVYSTNTSRAVDQIIDTTRT